ncbi:hypothetical protein FJQ98_16545 [Lysinibacillus agricola]|uniref:Uncharacterized protein n=1 Tax=Lysinibacillus agricola TaxID=2590012 RepID=A0ABX7AM37_9BACI|nr:MULTISPECIES: hypothetical protein [Lysinibacillus]KOS61463.1 hypothetical protein AN161_17890 [Lysinibacillus sp. FJAT-14222]QQP10855.1 hypothetical protein FJQ98_16545 [Lysinibacillus agricola]
MRKINYKSIPAYLELSNREIGAKLKKEEKSHESYEHDLVFENGLVLTLEINYDTNKWDYANHYINGYKAV